MHKRFKHSHSLRGGIEIRSLRKHAYACSGHINKCPFKHAAFFSNSNSNLTAFFLNRNVHKTIVEMSINQLCHFTRYTFNSGKVCIDAVCDQSSKINSLSEYEVKML